MAIFIYCNVLYLTMTDEFNLDFFKDRGFVRKQCVSCSSFFWTIDNDKKTCGDPACESYSFINNSPVYKKYNIDEMRDEFLNFFINDENFKHRFVEPYPVVPRWRDDVLLVNASIYDFQPQVTSGLVQPPGNPLTMSQPSIRMIDLDLVGKTGRHLTTFEMLCHDSFNYENKYVYWNNETVRYSYIFLTEKLKVDENLITYKEKPWFGGGNAGNAVEVFVRGLEVATLVFMDLKEDTGGDIEIDGTKYTKMPLRIVDTGYGLERLVWLSNGTSTIYESIYNNIIDLILEDSDAERIDSKIMEEISKISASVDPYSEKRVMDQLKIYMDQNSIKYDDEFIKKLRLMRDVYSLADHTKTLLLMFSDYVIPSNVKVGYLARTLIRRCFRFIEELSFRHDLQYILNAQYENSRKIVKRFDVNFINDILSIEREKYDTVNKSAYNTVRKFIKNDLISHENLLKLYESYGINEDMIFDYYHEITGKYLEIPDNFHELLIKNREKKTGKINEKCDYPPIKTRPLYYDNADIMEFTGNVLYSGDRRIILNQTAFYPEGGGQPYDLGYFIYNGKRVNVLNVQKYNDAIVHFLDGYIPENARIRGYVDYNRRKQLMIHHSATHLILGIMREYFGDHIWQSGVKKDINDSRIDITHYKKISNNDIEEIENRCFKYIRAGKKITVTNENWNLAIEKYGFRLFEGGVPLSSKLRVVSIEDIDSEGCGGTHLDNTIDIGFIKIIKVETLQEGIQRIIFSAGPAALRYVQSLYSIIRNQQNFMKVDEEKMVDYSRNMLDENINLKKELEDKTSSYIGNVISQFEHSGIFKLYKSSMNRGDLNKLIKGLYKIDGNKIILNTSGNASDITIISKQSLQIGENIIVALKERGISKPEGKIGNGITILHVETPISEKLIKEILVDITL